jgi:hypothetical protein
VKCCAPELFEGKPEHEWHEIAVNSGKRKDGKILNLASIYLVTPQTLAENNHRKVEETTQWIKNFQKTYNGYYGWVNEYGGVAEARGFAVAPWGDRVRWVNECRSSSTTGESPIRAAVNFVPQGLAADATKESCIRIFNLIKAKGWEDKVSVVGVIHDEVLIEIHAPCYLDTSKSKSEKGVFSDLVWTPSPFVTEACDAIKTIMCDVMTEIMGGLGTELEGRAGVAVAPYWSH